jgi:hypothetical protein
VLAVCNVHRQFAPATQARSQGSITRGAGLARCAAQT